MSEGEVDVQDVVDQQPSESEVKARRLGWLPQEEFQGNPEQWRDADSFLKRGEEIHGFMKADIEKLHTTVAQRDRELQELRASMEEFRKFHNETAERAYKRAIDELKQLKAEAVNQGDGSRVVELDDEIAQLKEAQKKPVIEEKKAAPAPSREYEDWLPQNRWFVEDAELNQLAESFGEVLMLKHPELKGKAFLDEITKRVKRAAPEKFENPNRNFAAVSGNGDNRPAAKKTKKSYEALPDEAKRECDNFVRKGWLTQEQYVKEYAWD